MQEDTDDHTTTYHMPQMEDGHQVYELIKEAPFLDANSLYYYLLFCHHFNKTSIIAKNQNNIIGYISGYLVPDKPDTLFIWQVVVAKSMHGKGIAKQMLINLINRLEHVPVHFLETTVTPSNVASDALFRSVARHFQTEVKTEDFFTSELFSKTEDHEEEILYQIGPFKQK